MDRQLEMVTFQPAAPDGTGPRTCAGPGCSQPVGRRNQAYCSTACRVRAHRAKVRAGASPIPHRRPPEPELGARVLPIPIERPARFGYLDPPYPGRADLYPEGQELDHAELISDACRLYPDGWALSTAADSLGDVMALCPRGVRVACWRRDWRPYLERAQSWEPVIVCGGRRIEKLNLPDSLIARPPRGWQYQGAKPQAFVWWVGALLGAQRGDELIESFPGSGGGARAWARYPGAESVAAKVRAAGHGAFGAQRRSQRTPAVKALTSTGTDSWRTPRAVLEALDGEFRFGLDAAAAIGDEAFPGRPYFTPDDDALKPFWNWSHYSNGAAIWLNPPYSMKGGKGRGLDSWHERAWQATREGAPAVVVLCPPNPGRGWFRRWAMLADEIRVYERRLAFLDCDGLPVGRNTQDSCLVIYRAELPPEGRPGGPRWSTIPVPT